MKNNVLKLIEYQVHFIIQVAFCTFIGQQCLPLAKQKSNTEPVAGTYTLRLHTPVGIYTKQFIVELPPSVH